MRKLSLVCLLVCSVAIAAIAQDSLAERARKARGVTASPSQSMGRFQNGEYINDTLGFKFTHIEGWDLVSRGQMNVNEAFGRSALGVGGRVSSQGREFMLRDGNGRNVILSISPISPGADRAKFGEQLRKDFAVALPKAQISDEPTTLGDAQHPFQTFRLTYEAMGTNVYQSSQAMLIGDYLVHFVVTAGSPESLNDTIQEARKHLVWKPAA